MIVGNDLAGDKVWADGQPNVVNPPKLTTAADPLVTPLPSGDIFPACAITRAASQDAQRRVEPGHLRFARATLTYLGKVVGQGQV